ncbi:MAG: hypothetical protein ACLFPI_02485 [Desulfobacterales bacterium]
MINFNKEKVVAIRVNKGVICTDCMTDGDWDLLTEDRVITQKDQNEKDKILFCDRCGEPI